MPMFTSKFTVVFFLAHVYVQHSCAILFEGPPCSVTTLHGTELGNKMTRPQDVCAQTQLNGMVTQTSTFVTPSCRPTGSTADYRLSSHGRFSCAGSGEYVCPGEKDFTDRVASLTCTGILIVNLSVFNNFTQRSTTMSQIFIFHFSKLSFFFSFSQFLYRVDQTICLGLKDLQCCGQPVNNTPVQVNFDLREWFSDIHASQTCTYSMVLQIQRGSHSGPKRGQCFLLEYFLAGASFHRTDTRDNPKNVFQT